MSDHKAIREALEAGPTDGEWHWHGDPVKGDPTGRVRFEVVTIGKTIARIYYSSYEGGPTNAGQDAAYIAACNPAAIRALLADLDEARAAITAAKAGGWVAVPVEPTEAQWGGLARDIMLAFDMGHKMPCLLIPTLRKLGNDIPQWLLDEVKDEGSTHVLSKGTRAVLIYRAMLAARPTTPPKEQA